VSTDTDNSTSNGGPIVLMKRPTQELMLAARCARGAILREMFASLTQKLVPAFSQLRKPRGAS
jgi:hypothetical protein